jgi:hypothetical protein
MAVANATPEPIPKAPMVTYLTRAIPVTRSSEKAITSRAFRSDMVQAPPANIYIFEYSNITICKGR